MAEKSVDGKGFVFFTEVFVRIQVYPSKGKRTIKKVLHVNSVSSLAAQRQLPGPCEQPEAVRITTGPTELGMPGDKYNESPWTEGSTTHRPTAPFPPRGPSINRCAMCISTFRYYFRVPVAAKPQELISKLLFLGVLSRNFTLGINK
ncbi:unnamed protein product [Porites lobata]|uniref:Uncharacterized protein n=1 Tax=Porites lobata TaxID=104759 RepID=A0ABN8R6M1_9CNID|nr:unnamed protein product [Porites lobata]